LCGFPTKKEKKVFKSAIESIFSTHTITVTTNEHLADIQL